MSGAEIANVLPQDMYGDVLVIGATNTGLAAVTPTPIGDGLGNDSPLEISQTVINMDRSDGKEWQLDGVAVTATAAQLNSAGSGVNTVVGTANEITVNTVGTTATVSLPAALTFTGKTVTGGTFSDPTLVGPQLGTPDSGTLTNCTGLPLTTGVTGTLAIANGGTNGTATPTNGGISYGTGAAYAFSLAGTSGQVLRSGGAGSPTWADLSAFGVTTFAGGTTGLTPAAATSGAITLAGTLAVANGGTGITSFGTGVATALGQNVNGASGGIVLGTSASLTTPTINTAASVGGTWTAAATWTLPAHTLGGTLTLNGQSFSGTCANGGTFTTIDINGGTVDGTVIGGSSAAAITGTTILGSSVSSTNDLRWGGGASGDGRLTFDTSSIYLDNTDSTGSIFFRTNSTVNQFRISHVATATNYVVVAGSNGGNPSISTSGGSLSFDSVIAMTNQSVAAAVAVASTHRLNITINGTAYGILMVTP